MTSIAEPTAEGERPASWRSRWSLKQMARRPEFGAFVATVVVYAFFAVSTRGAGFVSVDGTAGWLDTAAELGIIAIPIGVLMVAGEFDLSVGAVVGASSIIVAIGSTIFGSPIWLVIALSLVMGAGIGVFNGLLTVRTGLPSFIVTLAASFSVGGLSLGFARLLTNTTTVSVKAAPSGARRFCRELGAGQYLDSGGSA